MIKQTILHVDIRILEPLRVIFRQCIFREPTLNYDSAIRRTFQFLGDWATCMGLHPADLVHVGVPIRQGNHLAAYTCCMEYVLPFIDENAGVSLGELPGGRYVVVRAEKSPAKIRQVSMELNSVFMPQHQLIQDAHRPTYEIYHEKEMEYCVPLAK